MQSDSGEESDFVFTQRSRERHRTMAGHVITPDGAVLPAGSSMEHGAEATNNEVAVQGAEVVHSAGSGEEVQATEENERRCPWEKIGLLVVENGLRREEEEMKRREEKVKKRREQEEGSNKEQGSKPRGVKRGRVAGGSDQDADLFSSGEEPNTSSGEDNGGSGHASTVAKRQHTS